MEKEYKTKNNLLTFKEVAKKRGFEVRHFSIPLSRDEDFLHVLTPFEFSLQNGGIVDSVSFYNNFYLYPTKK